MRRLDTAPAAEEAQLRIQCGMSEQERFLLAFDMSEFARELAREGILQVHPEWTPRQIAHELLRLAFLPAPLPARFSA